MNHRNQQAYYQQQHAQHQHFQQQGKYNSKHGEQGGGRPVSHSVNHGHHPHHGTHSGVNHSAKHGANQGYQHSYGPPTSANPPPSVPQFNRSNSASQIQHKSPNIPYNSQNPQNISHKPPHPQMHHMAHGPTHQNYQNHQPPSHSNRPLNRKPRAAPQAARVPITSIEHHLDQLYHQQIQLNDSTHSYFKTVKDIGHHSYRHNTNFSQLVDTSQHMDKPTFDLMNFQRQKVHQINGNFRNVFKAKLPTQQQINQQNHRLKNNSIPELENKLRKRKKEFTKTGSMKVKNDIEYMERQLQEYHRRITTPKRAQTRSELVHGVMQEVVLPGSMDFAYRQSNYHKHWHQNINKFQTKTFTVSCTKTNYTKEKSQILSELKMLDIVDPNPK